MQLKCLFVIACMNIGVIKRVTHSVRSGDAEGKWSESKKPVGELDSPAFIPDPVPVSVSIGHSETATNPRNKFNF